MNKFNEYLEKARTYNEMESSMLGYSKYGDDGEDRQGESHMIPGVADIRQKQSAMSKNIRMARGEVEQAVSQIIDYLKNDFFNGDKKVKIRRTKTINGSHLDIEDEKNSVFYRAEILIDKHDDSIFRNDDKARKELAQSVKEFGNSQLKKGLTLHQTNTWARNNDYIPAMRLVNLVLHFKFEKKARALR